MIWPGDRLKEGIAYQLTPYGVIVAKEAGDVEPCPDHCCEDTCGGVRVFVPKEYKPIPEEQLHPRRK